MITVPKSERPKPPETLDEAVDIVFFKMSKEDREAVRKVEREDLSDLHFSPGMDIRNVVVHPGGEKLLRSVQEWKYDELPGSSYLHMHPDNVSDVIIEALWERLQREAGS